jgi:hypothetical protein
MAVDLHRSERPVHPAEEPADAERGNRRCIGLGLDRGAEPLVEVRSRIARGVRGLAVEVLRGPGRLVEFSPNLRFHVARDAAGAFFHLAAEVSGRAG